MRKKLLAVLMTGAMVASFAGSATAVFAKSDDDNKLTVWAWDQNFNIKSMQIAADQYAKDHEGFSVDIVETSSDDCQTKQQQMQAITAHFLISFLCRTTAIRNI